MSFIWKDNKASNAIFLDESVPGKGKAFKCRFLEAGLVKYSFGVCLLERETINKFVQEFVGCPVIINHQELTEETADTSRVGVISDVWFDSSDGWFWCKGIIFDDEAIDLIENQNFNISCQYSITEYSNNTENKLHNGNPYDKVILNGKPEHLAIVKTPRYENAMIAVNALDLTAENEEEEQGEQPQEPENTENIPELIMKAINEIKELNMFSELFKKKEQKMDKETLKSLFTECLQEALLARNAEDEEDKKEDAENEDEEKELEKAENKKCKNEDVDKREIIRQIMAIAGKEEASEDVKTIAKLAEKLAYDKSEADTADNGKKAKCEDDEEEDKEEAKNKAKNAIDDMKGLFASAGVVKAASKYVTQSDAIELGNQLF